MLMLNRLYKKIGIANMNDKLLFAFSTVLFLPILFDFITSATGGNSSVYTYILYIGTLIIFFMEFYIIIKLRNVFLLIGIYSLFFINSLLFPDSQYYIYSTDFILVCLYFIPIGLLFFTQIRDWSSLAYILNKYSIYAFLIGIYILLFTDVRVESKDDSLFTYMEFSYALLPFLCASFARYYETRSKFTLVLFLLGVLEILAYGCRGAVISTMLFVCSLILSNGKTNRIFLFFFVAVALFVYSNFESIVNYLLSFELFSDSYFLQHFVNGEMFESSRSEIYKLCENRISSMGLEVCGVFGDRPFCGSVYPHNFVYEIMMQFGWFLGPTILLFYLALIVKCMLKRECRTALLFILCALLFKYMLSGSYLLSGLFWIASSALVSMKSSKY